MLMRRRHLLGAGVAVGALAACGSPSSVTTPTPPEYAARLTDILRRYLDPTPDHPDHPSYAGAVLLVAVNGVVTVHEAVGDALRYGPGPVELPAPERVPMRRDSLFDLASITKVVTALLAVRLVDQGRLALPEPVARYLPGYPDPTVTVGMLLTHTSGLPDYVDLARLPDHASRRAAVLGARRTAPAGSLFRYSDVGMLLLGMVLERVTGEPLDVAVGGLLGPLGLRDTGFNPVARFRPDEVAQRVVATEAKPGRGLVRGVVHDENAYALGGVAGHAGLFATAADLALVGQLLLDGGAYGGVRVLAPDSARRMLLDLNGDLPAFDPQGRPGRAAHGLGVELAQPWFMGRLSGPRTFGHTGFTGTSLVVDPLRRLVLVLLTNRVHPDRKWGGVNPTRVAVANALADAIAPAQV